MSYKLNMGEDGILRVTILGDFDKKDVPTFLKEQESFLGAPIFVDSRQLGKMDSTARKTLADLGRSQPVKVAVVGATSYVRVLANFFNKAAGRDSIRFYESEDEALAWLKG